MLFCDQERKCKRIIEKIRHFWAFIYRFTDPVVLLERSNIAPSQQSLNDNKNYSDLAKTLAKKGNEGLRPGVPQTCCLCNKKSSNRNNLLRHLETVHCRTNKFVCDFCPKVFFSRNGIYSHMKIHCTGGTQAKDLHTCCFCHKNLSSRNALRRHLKTVECSKTSFFCDLCPKVCVWKGGISIHMKTHRTKYKIENQNSVIALARKGNETILYKSAHTCCLCQKVFSSRYNLIQHIQSAHSRTTQFFCDLCPKIYFNKTLISNHMTVHKNKSFHCNFCDYKTAKKYALNFINGFTMKKLNAWSVGNQLQIWKFIWRCTNQRWNVRYVYKNLDVHA